MGEMKKGYGLEILCRNGKVVFMRTMDTCQSLKST
jgi:hypothetical protein